MTRTNVRAALANVPTGTLCWLATLTPEQIVAMIPVVTNPANYRERLSRIERDAIRDREEK